MGKVHLTLEEAHELAMKCLLTNGCDDENAKAAADRMIQAEGDICQSHGLFRLPWYCNGVKSGRAIVPGCVIEVFPAGETSQFS